MNTTEWTLPPSVKGPQVGQLIAGRYRLALFKGGDDIAEVWHAVEESTQQVVTLEILRDRSDEALRTRFLEQARRMSQIERPSVMKVAAIHDDASETFVVFEHLIPLSIELPEWTPVELAAAAAPEPAADVAAPEPAAAAVAPEPMTAVAQPELAVAQPELTVAQPELEWSIPVAPVPTAEPESLAPATPATVEPETVTTSDPETVEASAPTVLITRPAPPHSPRLPRSVVVSLPDVSGLVASATRFAERARVFARDLRLDTLVATARARVPQRIDIALVKTTGARLVKTGRPLVDRARHNQIVMAVVAAAVVLTVFVASPLDDAIASALRPKLAPVPTTAPLAPTAPLARAPFEVPPLSAYRAAFEAQAPYPKAAPNGTVEWTVALRNTGSAGWYRGIEGAQVALALADGTGVAVQSTEYVAPGQVGWFVVHFRARAEPGTYNVSLVPRVDGRGPLPDLGLLAVVTVSKNP